MWEFCGESCAWLNEREGKVNIGKLYLSLLFETDYVEVYRKFNLSTLDVNLTTASWSKPNLRMCSYMKTHCLIASFVNIF